MGQARGIQNSFDANADKIVVMNDGKIMDIGNHEELLARNEVYADLFYTQQKGVSE